MSILFINSSMNRDGNTVQLAQQLLQGRDFETLHLNDYLLMQLGQDRSHDQFASVFEKIEQADTVVFGTPIYWHDMTGSLKLLIDRMSEDVDWEASHLKGKQVILIAQGAMPGRKVLAHCDNIFQQLTSRMGMTYLGMVSTNFDLRKIKQKIGE